MQHFLPMVNPLDWRCASGLHLQLKEMPNGLTPGSYARVIMDNMNTPRSFTEGSTTQTMSPRVRWADLFEHAKSYASVNTWREDGAEIVVEKLLSLGASVDEGFYWINDVKEWPFSGNRCLLSWLNVLEKDANLNSKIKPGASTRACDGSGFLEAGRWLVQRPYLLEEAPVLFRKVALFVEALSNMTPEAFTQYATKNGTNIVRGVSTKNNRPSLRRALSSTSITRRPQPNNWSDEYLNAVGLGMAWEISAQGHPETYARVSMVLNRLALNTPKVLFDYHLNDSAWFNACITSLTSFSQTPLLELVSSMAPHSCWDTLTPKDTILLDMFNTRTCDRLLAQGDIQANFAFYKVALASSLQKCFSPYTNYSAVNDKRLVSFQPLVSTFTHSQKQELLQEFVNTMHWAASSRASDYIKADPWGGWFDILQCTTARMLDDYDDSVSVVDLCQGWLASLDQPYKEDLDILISLGADIKAVGLWMECKLATSLSNDSMPTDSFDTTAFF